MRKGGPLDRWRWARDYSFSESLSSPEASILVELAYYSGADGISWPSQTRLAEITRLGDRTVRRALHTLVARGAVEIRAKSRGRFGGATTYELVGASVGWEVRRPESPPVFSHKAARESSVEGPISHIRRPESPSKAARESKQGGQRVQARRPESPPPPYEPSNEPSNEPGIEPRKRGKRTPTVSEDFIREMEKTFADAKFDVREEIARALSHVNARKYTPPDLYVKGWLRPGGRPELGTSRKGDAP